MPREWTVLPNGSQSSPNGWSYGCQDDITDLVKDALPDDFVGNATYWVGHVDLGAGSAIGSDHTGYLGEFVNQRLIVGNSGTILQYDGASWIPAVSGTTRDLKGVWGSNATNVWAVGANSAIRKYTGSWAGQTRSDGRTETLRGVWGSSATDVWIVGDRYTRSSQYRYTLLHTTNGGTSWTNTGDSLTSGVDLNGVWGSSGSNVIAVGASGRIMRWNGSAWSTKTSGTSQTLYGVWGTSANNVYAVGASGTILRYNGTSWSTMTSGTSQTLYGVWGSCSGRRLCRGGRWDHTALQRHFLERRDQRDLAQPVWRLGVQQHRRVCGRRGHRQGEHHPALGWKRVDGGWRWDWPLDLEPPPQR